MYVCVCNAVTEQQIHEAVTGGAQSVKALNKELGIGSQCGACVGCAKNCLNKAQPQKASHTHNVFPIAEQQAA